MARNGMYSKVITDPFIASSTAQTEKFMLVEAVRTSIFIAGCSLQLRNSVIFLFLRHWSIRGWYVYSYQLALLRSSIPAQAPSDCGRPHQGRPTAFGKELPPTEARRNKN